jgi:DNA-binding PadR family transcriptional regulator
MCTIKLMTDSELAILGLLGEMGSASGYGVAMVARARGMKRWAGLSSTSVYKGLRSLAARKLVLARRDLRKRGKGPAGNLFLLAPAGRKRVQQSLLDALEAAPEQSVSYRLALAFIGVLERRQAVAQLRKRSEMLATRMREVQIAARAMPGEALPIGARLVFEYALRGLEAECRVTDALLTLLKDQKSSS